MNEKPSTENQLKEFKATALSMPERYRGVTVRSETDLHLANQDLRNVKKVLVMANEIFDPIIKTAHAAHRMALDQKKKVVDPILQAERYVKRAIGDYHAELERERLILQLLGDKVCRIDELSESLGVSDATVRRDLQSLALRGTRSLLFK